MKTILCLVACSLLFSAVVAENIKEICEEKGEGYHLKEKTGCKSYYSCIKTGNGYDGREYECPDGYLFNEKVNACDKAGTFECESVVIPLCPQEEGVSQLPAKGTKCKNYFLCIDGDAYMQSCAKGLLFDAEIGKCDIEDKVECYECPEHDDPTNLVYYANKKNCAGYFICLKGEPQEFECAAGLHYKEDARHCTTKYEAECKYLEWTTTTTESETDPTTDAPEEDF